MLTICPDRRALTRALLAAALIASATPVALAADWPAFRHGQWRFERTMEGDGPKQTVATTECMDPTAEQQKQRATLTKAGCRFSPLTQSGSTYRYSATCAMAGMNATSNSVLEVQGPEAYTITVESIMGNTKTHEVVIARRVGDCAK
jgi:hypothetical protein